MVILKRMSLVFAALIVASGIGWILIGPEWRALLAHQPCGHKQFQMMGQRRPGDARAITQRADGQPVRACAHQQTENLQPLL